MRDKNIKNKVIDVTVAAICNNDDRVLTVTERARGRIVLNFPGGHIESGETPEQAVAREVLEETGFRFAPSFLLGCYLWEGPNADKRYLRIIYGGRTGSAIDQPVCDPNIVASQWLSPAAIAARAKEHRYPIVQRGLDDYLAGIKTALQPTPFAGLPGNVDAVAAQASLIQ